MELSCTGPSSAISSCWFDSGQPHHQKARAVSDTLIARFLLKSPHEKRSGVLNVSSRSGDVRATDARDRSLFFEINPQRKPGVHDAGMK